MRSGAGRISGAKFRYYPIFGQIALIYLWIINGIKQIGLVDFIKKNIKLFIFLLLFIVIAILLVLTKQHNKAIRDDHIVVCADIVRIWVTKNGSHIIYEFGYKGKRRYNKTCTRETREKFQNKQISQVLVAIQKGNPNNNVLIENESDFLKYNIQKDTPRCP